MQPKSFPNGNRFVIVLVHEMLSCGMRLRADALQVARRVHAPEIVVAPTREQFVERDVDSTIRRTTFGITRRPVW
jgi:hypothetical protein